MSLTNDHLSALETARRQRIAYEHELASVARRRTEHELAATERLAAFQRRTALLAAGSAYVIGRIDAGDSRVDQADAEEFGEFYAEHNGNRLTAADLFERFTIRLSERDDS